MKYLIFFLLSLPLFGYAQLLNNCRVTTQMTFGASTVSVQALAQKANRRCLVINNVSGGTTAYIKFNSAHTGLEGMQLLFGETWNPQIPPMNSIWIKATPQGGATTIPITIWQGE